MFLVVLGFLGRCHMIMGDGGGKDREVSQVKGRSLWSFFDHSSLAFTHFQFWTL